MKYCCLGSAEGFSLAEHAINTASKQGNWVLLKNIHLAPQWLKELEKKLYELKPHESFRLFFIDRNSSESMKSK